MTRSICFSNQSRKIKNIFTKVLKGHIAVATTNLKKDDIGKKSMLELENSLKKVA